MRCPQATTEAFSFVAPDELSDRMMMSTAWAYLRRGALVVREVGIEMCVSVMPSTLGREIVS